MHAFLPCTKVPESMFYVGPSAADEVQVSVSTITGTSKRTLSVTPSHNLDSKTANRVAHTDRPVAVQCKDGSCSYFSPTDDGGVVVAHSPRSDDSEVIASIVECQ